MPRKPKFNPQITRIKLNPEQAVLECGCYMADRLFDPIGPANVESAAVCTLGELKGTGGCFNAETRASS